jgi:hypothetical protein
MLNLVPFDATLVLAAEWWSNVMVAEVQASVMFHTAWDVARCFLLNCTMVSSQSLRRQSAIRLNF